MAKAKNLVILESPSKAKTIKKILGSSYTIAACVGHVRDLPKSQFGVDVEADYEPKYITIRGKGDILAGLRKDAKNASKIYLATDPDREGEAISWHLFYALKLEGKNIQRITFNEITKNAVKKSLKEARAIDMNLVDAQQARRVLDRIVGYRISPLLWRKVRKGTSAGRVQSVVLRLICEREEEIEHFVPQEYWTLEVELSDGKKGKLTARYTDKKELNSKDEVDAIVKSLDGAVYTVLEIKHGNRQRKPPAPFTTSTLQQEASKLFGFAAAKTMRIAQQLYEGVDVEGFGTIGLVSYIRTDSLRVSDEAYNVAYNFIKTTYGEKYLPAERPIYKSKGRAQDAHEAIRPTHVEITPETAKKSLNAEQLKIYKLIWERLLCSQMSPALYDTQAVKISVQKKGHEEIMLRASGSVLVFDGYLAVYSKNEDSEKDVEMPKLKVGQKLVCKEILPAQHFTQPPPRYSEGSMVKTMEELGIGRPSTFASTMSTLMYRGYVTKENRVLYPTELGEIVNEIMIAHFEDIACADFTAKMEDDLDRVEHGELEWKEIVRKFYPPLAQKVEKAEEVIGKIEIKDEETDVICEKCGRNMVIKRSKFGRFLACPGFPECRNAKPMLEDAGVDCPLCEGRVVVKKSKKGRMFYGCDKNPECEFISWNLPTGTACPECGKYLVVKGRKNPFEACSECGYTNKQTE